MSSTLIPPFVFLLLALTSRLYEIALLDGLFAALAANSPGWLLALFVALGCPLLAILQAGDRLANQGPEPPARRILYRLWRRPAHRQSLHSLHLRATHARTLPALRPARPLCAAMAIAAATPPPTPPLPIPSNGNALPGRNSAMPWTIPISASSIKAIADRLGRCFAGTAHRSSSSTTSTIRKAANADCGSATNLGAKLN